MERYLILGNIAFVTMELGDLNLSEKLFRQTMLSIKERLGSTSAHYHNARGNLGICLLKGEGKESKSEGLQLVKEALRVTLKIPTSIPQASHPWAIKFKTALAAAEQDRHIREI